MKSEKEKPVSYINSYIWSLEKWYWRIYLQGKNRDADIEKELVDTQWGKEKVWWMEEVALTYIYYHV